MNIAGIIAGMTMKEPGMAELNNMALHICENPAAIIQNRERLAEEIGCRIEDFVCAVQTHSANFHKVTKEDRGRGALTMDDAIP